MQRWMVAWLIFMTILLTVSFIPLFFLASNYEPPEDDGGNGAGNCTIDLAGKGYDNKTIVQLCELREKNK